MGKVPYFNLSVGEIISGIIHETLRPIVPEDCDTLWAEIMKSCWQQSPACRPPIKKIVLHLERAISYYKSFNKIY